jgi:hypothetical protein
MQTTIPGAEPISQRELAKRRAALPLRPMAEQRPCDLGLFSDDARQTELFTMTTKGGGNG